MHTHASCKMCQVCAQLKAGARGTDTTADGGTAAARKGHPERAGGLAGDEISTPFPSSSRAEVSCDLFSPDLRARR